MAKAKLYLFIYIGILFLSCSQAPINPFENTGRNVLAELFTWARCVYCPYAAQALDSLAKEYADSVIVIAYHRRISQDTLSPIYVENRREFYYNTGAEPVVFFDGNGPVRTENPSMNYNTYKGYIQLARSRPAPLKILLTTQVVNDSAVVNAKLIPTGLINSNNLRVLFVVTEDRIRFSLSGATDSIFNNVMRAMLPTETGISYIPQIGETTNFEIKFPIHPSWDRANLKVVVFVQNFNTKEIIQSAQKRLIDLNIYDFTLHCLTDTFQVTSPNSLAEYHFLLTNTGTQRDVYEITSQILDSVPGWDVIFCVRGSCAQPGGVFYDTLNVGAADSTICVTVFTGQNSGTEVTALRVRSLAEPTKQKTIRVYTQVNKKTGGEP
ncbi:MAG: Omp28-related outer membrane protein [candidate division WOR-3 bacterium]